VIKQLIEFDALGTLLQATAASGRNDSNSQNLGQEPYRLFENQYSFHFYSKPMHVWKDILSK